MPAWDLPEKEIWQILMFSSPLAADSRSWRRQ
jgi:hypothetical protein